MHFLLDNIRGVATGVVTVVDGRHVQRGSAVPMSTWRATSVVWLRVEYVLHVIGYVRERTVFWEAVFRELGGPASAPALHVARNTVEFSISTTV